MATIDKTVKFKAGGKEYAVCYPLKAVMGAEQELPGNSLFKAVAVASLTNFYVMLKWGLIGGGMPENTPAETFDEIWSAGCTETWSRHAGHLPAMRSAEYFSVQS